jgi:hypothetical protein
LIASTTRCVVVKSAVLSPELDMAPAAERRGHRALDRRPAADASDREVVDLHARTARGRGAHAAHQHVALSHGVDLSVGTFDGRHEERSAPQGLGVAHRRHRDVYRLAGLHERRQHRGNHHGGDVLQLQIRVGREVDAELAQHVHDALHGKRRLRGLIAAAVQADHQPIADQLVAAHAVYRGEVLDALGARWPRKRGEHDRRDQEQGGEGNR